MMVAKALIAAVIGSCLCLSSATQQCFDPMTGEDTEVGSEFKLPVRYGQTIWFSSPGTMKRFTGSALEYQVNATIGPRKGHSGLPDMSGETFRCPMCGSNNTIDSKTPRVQLQHGQNIYFKCWGCVNMFLADPSKILGVESPSIHCLQGPPPGPTDIAYCPVTGERINITTSGNYRSFGGDQKIYASSQNAVAELQQNLATYFLGAKDFPRQVGPQGAPDMRGKNVSDAMDGLTNVEITMKTPRIQFRHGQNLYFASYDQLNDFWITVTRMTVVV